MIGLIGQEERGRRHRVEQLHNLGTGWRTQSLQVWGDIVNDCQEGRIDCSQFALAGGYECVNGLNEEIGISPPEPGDTDSRRQRLLSLKGLV